MTVNGISLAGRRVLIVEDNFHIAHALARVLTEAIRGARLCVSGVPMAKMRGLPD